MQVCLMYGCALENNVFTASFDIAYTTCHFQGIKPDSSIINQATNLNNSDLSTKCTILTLNRLAPNDPYMGC